MPPPPQPPSPQCSSLQVSPPGSREQPQRRQQRKRGQPRHARRPPRQSRPDSSGGGGGGGGGSDSSDHDGDGDHDHDDDDDSTNDGYSSHPSIYSASPVGSDSDRDARARALVQAQVHAQAAAAHKLARAAAAAAGGIFEQDVEPQGPSPLIGRRPRRGAACAGSGTGTGTGALPDVPGVGVLETICERKSTDGDEMACDADGGFSTDEDGIGDRGGDEDGFITDDDDDDYGDDDDDDEFSAHGPGYGRAFYYEYASPTQPLHPARSLSMSARGSLSPSLPSIRHTIRPGLPMPVGRKLTGQHRNHSIAVPFGLLLWPATAAPAAEEHTRHPYLLLALTHALAHALAPAAAEPAAGVSPAAPAAAACLPPAHQLAPVLRRADGPSLPPRPLGRSGVWGQRFCHGQRERDARRARELC